MLAQYAKSMPFVRWQPPETMVIQVRCLMRRIEQLTKQRTGLRNQLHALTKTPSMPGIIIEQIQNAIEQNTKDIEALEDEAVNLMEESQEVAKINILKTIPGVGQKTAMVLYSELMCLPKDMTVRQWVAHCGLDVCEHSSGTSVSRRNKISKRGNHHIRRVLYLSALSAPKACKHVKAYRQSLIDRGKTPKQAAVAVMRKLLHSIFGMFKHNASFDPNKFRNANFFAISD